MRILLLGKNGQLGHDLNLALAGADLLALGRKEVDLCNVEALQRAVRSFKPDCIINAAAYTAVDRAESDADMAYAVNSLAPSILAEEAARLGAWLVHYSTDYVFDGAGKNPYTESCATGPQGVYGKSKLEGEIAIQTSGCKHLILRTAWVYGPHGANFAKTMLRLAAERDSLRVVADQIGTPTSTQQLVRYTEQLLSNLGDVPSGVYHATAGGQTSWHSYARFIIETARRYGATLKCSSENVAAIVTKDYPTPASRPAYSVLNLNKIQKACGFAPLSWEADVESFVRNSVRELVA